MVTLEEAVLTQTMTGHTTTLGDFAVFLLVLFALIWAFVKWDQEWRDPVKRRAMLGLEKLKLHRK
jgi:hypothetical protein